MRGLKIEKGNEEDAFCESCVYGKQHKTTSFKEQNNRPQSHLRTIGSTTFVYIPKALWRKWKQTSWKGILGEYADSRKLYGIYNPMSENVHTCKDVEIIEERLNGSYNNTTTHNLRAEKESTPQNKMKHKTKVTLIVTQRNTRTPKLKLAPHQEEKRT